METLKTLIYFSLFDHPVSKEEVYRFCKHNDKVKIDDELRELSSNDVIQSNGDYFFYNGGDNIVERRIAGYEAAEAITPKAIKRARLIYSFPFVRAVGFSGSFSKDYFDEESDIDFFIITKRDRLWIARTLLVLFKKIFLLNSKKFFCVNYFVAENELLIQEQNRFTATELVTLKPVFGMDYFSDFYRENQWAYDFFPNADAPVAQLGNPNAKRSLFSRSVERLLSGRLGEKLDDLFRTMTIKKWMSKFGEMEKRQFEIALKSTKNISKHHPRNFQQKVVDQINVKYREAKVKYSLDLSKEYA